MKPSPLDVAAPAMGERPFPRHRRSLAGSASGACARSWRCGRHRTRGCSTPASCDSTEPSSPLALPSRRQVLVTAPSSLAVVAAVLVQPRSAGAATKRLKAPPLDEFMKLPDFDWRGAPHPGLRYADLLVGTGKEVAPGTVLTVQYECRYKGIVAVSSRESRLLGGNRTLSEAFTFKYGALPDEFNRPKAKRKTRVGVGLEIRTPDDPASEPGVFVIADVQAKGPASEAGVRPLERIVAVDGTLASELSLPEIARRLGAGEPGSELTLTLRGPPSSAAAGSATRDVKLIRAEVAVKPTAGASSNAYDGPAGGLFAGSSGPKPPPALYLAMAGMREGGRRTVLVPADVGYDDAGINEIPPDADFTLDIELLTVKA